MQTIQTDAAPAAIGPYSQAISHNGWVFTSGQLPIDTATGALLNDTIEIAARQALNNLQAVLAAAGAQLADVVKTTVFLRDMNDFTAFNAVYAAFFNAPCPARSCVQVAALPKGARVEIEAIACTVKMTG
jgi:2-iminobutanoate/2-iminopropanoate deaminase